MSATAITEAIARITAADDVHYNFDVWAKDNPNVARIIDSGNRLALVALADRADSRANKYFRAMDDATLLTAPFDHDELQTWLQKQCDAAVARVDVDRIAANVARKYGI